MPNQWDGTIVLDNGGKGFAYISTDDNGNVTGLVGPGGTYAVLLTLICTAAPVSVTGTTDKTVLRTVAIPDGAMGANSILRIRPIWNYTNSANNKSIGVGIGTAPASVTNIYARTRTTTAADLPLIELQNRNNVASQIIRYSQAGTYTTATSSANATSTINFSTSGMNLYIYGTLTNTGETITLESVHVEIINPYA